MAQLNPYLSFGGNCREAMTFYQRCLGGELQIQTVGESPAAPHFPAEAQGSVLHSMLQGDGVVIMAADAVDGSPVVPGTAVTLCVNSGTRDETRSMFEKLADGGTVTAPLKEEFFGLFGQITDRFGVNWMFQAE